MARQRRPQPKQPTKPDWNFFSFPVLVGFVTGVFITCLLIAIDIGGFIGNIHPVFWYASLLGSSFCLAHVFTRQLARFRSDRRREREDEAERERRALAARAARAAETAGTEPAPPKRRRRRRAG
jgi:hypothetical protein